MYAQLSVRVAKASGDSSLMEGQDD
jgi:hypothetical protein